MSPWFSLNKSGLTKGFGEQSSLEDQEGEDVVRCRVELFCCEVKWFSKGQGAKAAGK